jgi:hypothetical protein
MECNLCGLILKQQSPLKVLLVPTFVNALLQSCLLDRHICHSRQSSGLHSSYNWERGRNIRFNLFSSAQISRSRRTLPRSVCHFLKCHSFSRRRRLKHRSINVRQPEESCLNIVFQFLVKQFRSFVSKSAIDGPGFLSRWMRRSPSTWDVVIFRCSPLQKSAEI